jgi:3-(3-hydroxy-phenyl)propionate hydroxylase
MAQVALQRTDDRTEALREIVLELLRTEDSCKRIAAEMSGLGIHYDLGGEHPVVGRRMPDLDLTTANGSLRVYSVLHNARPALINLGEPRAFDIPPWADRVQLIDADYAGAWNLPAIGTVSPPTAVLVRPDGYVAWAGDGSQKGFRDALTAWFGSPSA